MGCNKVVLISSKRKWETKPEHVYWKKNYTGVIELYISKESFWEVVDIPGGFLSIVDINPYISYVKGVRILNN